MDPTERACWNILECVAVFAVYFSGPLNDFHLYFFDRNRLYRFWVAKLTKIQYKGPEKEITETATHARMEPTEDDYLMKIRSEIQDDTAQQVGAKSSNECVICLSNEGPPYPVQGGCACRGAAGFAHVACRATAAFHAQDSAGPKVWWDCMTCKQTFTGETRLLLANIWLESVTNVPVKDDMDYEEQLNMVVEKLSMASNLGSALCQAGKYMAAEKIERQVWEKEKEVFGIDHHLTLMSGSNLATTLCELGQYDEAELIEQDVWAKNKETLGNDHPATLTSAGNLATTFGNQGKHDEALVIERQVWETEQRVLGVHHPSTLISASNLAVTLSKLGIHDEALLIQHATLIAKKRVFGEDHPGTLDTMGNLGLALFNKGNFDDAFVIQHETWISRKRFGVDHPDTLESAYHTSNTLFRQGKLDEAYLIQQETLFTQKQVLGENHPQTIKSANGLLRITNKMKKRDNIAKSEDSSGDTTNLHQLSGPI